MNNGGIRCSPYASLAARLTALMAELHDRMPVILDPDTESAWLEPGQAAARLHDLLGGLRPGDTALRPVGPAVNDARYDGPECLAPASDELQTALF